MTTDKISWRRAFDMTFILIMIAIIIAMIISIVGGCSKTPTSSPLAAQNSVLPLNHDDPWIFYSPVYDEFGQPAGPDYGRPRLYLWSTGVSNMVANVYTIALKQQPYPAPQYPWRTHQLRVVMRGTWDGLALPAVGDTLRGSMVFSELAEPPYGAVPDSLGPVSSAVFALGVVDDHTLSGYFHTVSGNANWVSLTPVQFTLVTDQY